MLLTPKDLVRPSDIPFPVGPATCAISMDNVKFKGGLPVSDRYPLVSVGEPQLAKGQARLVTAEEWRRLSACIGAGVENEADRERVRKERALKEASDELKRSWGQTEKTYADLIREAVVAFKAEKAASEKAEVEAILSRKEQARQATIRKTRDMLHKEKEAPAAVTSALLVSEALAENERILASKKTRELREAKQEEDAWETLRLHTQRYEQELKQRELSHMEYERSLQHFQKLQAAERLETFEVDKAVGKLDLAKAKLASALEIEERRSAEERAMNEKNAYRAQLQTDMEEASTRRRQTCDSELADLNKALEWRDAFLARQAHYEKELKKKIVETGKKQRQAATKLGERKTEAEKRRKQLETNQVEAAAARAGALAKKQEAEKQLEQKMRLDEELTFRRQHAQVLARRAEDATADMLLERYTDQARAAAFVEDVRERMGEHRRKQEVIGGFWRRQMGEKEAVKAAETRLAEHEAGQEWMLRAVEDEQARMHVARVEAEQRAKGRDERALVPIRRLAAEREAREDGVATDAVAVDQCGIRIRPRRGNSRPSDFRASDDRERLSLNWSD